MVIFPILEKLGFIKAYRRYKPENPLLPCPFCGGEAVFNKVDKKINIMCEECHFQSAKLSGLENQVKQLLIEKWNSRYKDFHVYHHTSHGHNYDEIGY